MQEQISVFRVTRPAIKGKLQDPRATYEHFKGQADWDREAMIVIYLNSQGHIVHQELHSIGGLTSSAVYPREIMKLALMKSATALILIHNHPSGDTEPSRADREITRDLYRVGAVLDVEVHDHIIIGQGTYYSFAEKGLMDQIKNLALETPLIRSPRGAA